MTGERPKWWPLRRHSRVDIDGQSVERSSVKGPVIQIKEARDVAIGIKDPDLGDRGPDPIALPIGDITDAFALGVHEAIDEGAGAAGLPRLTPYLFREHDKELRAAVQKAADGCSTLAVLSGESSTGKTRSCWEAIQTLPPGWRLWQPTDPYRFTAAYQQILSAIGPRTVLWLDEIDRYLLDPPGDLGERIAVGLNNLLASEKSRPVLILGTIWPERWSTLTSRPKPPHRSDAHRSARSFLLRKDSSIHVPEQLLGRALDDLRNSADPRLTHACRNATEGRIIQHLAGVPVVRARYEAMSGAARALIHAAMDVRRLNHGKAIPLSLLEEAAEGYLTDHQYHRLEADWLQSAVAEATADCRGAQPPLSRMRSRTGESDARNCFCLSDTLEAAAERPRNPPSLLTAIQRHAAKEDLAQIALTLDTRGWDRTALTPLFLAAVEAGDTLTLGRTADLVRESGNVELALSLYRRAAEAGDLSVLVREGGLLQREGRIEDALARYEQAAKAGHAEALELAARMLRGEGRAAEALSYYRRAAAAGLRHVPQWAAEYERQTRDERQPGTELCIHTEPQQGAVYETLLTVAKAAEEFGYLGFFRSDHYLRMASVDGMPGPTDAWITLAGLARETSRIRLGTLMTAATFRHPGVLAIQVAQVDQMSGGRIELGLGAGWYEEEHRAYGIPFPKERFPRFEEQIEIVTGLWQSPPGETFNFDGKYYTLRDSPALPKPVQPRVPLIIGGHGATRTPRLAARHADEFNVPFASVEDCRRQINRVRRVAAAHGRDPEEITYSVTLAACVGSQDSQISRRATAIGREVDELKANGLAGTPNEVVEKIGKYSEVGVRRVYLQILDLSDLDHLELIADRVKPQLNSLLSPR
jgi:F420-dependent oxidoreductase-like protein